MEHVITLSGHEGRVWHASWSMDGSKIVSCGEDKTVRIWVLNLDSLKYHLICTLDDGQSRTIRSCEWSPDSKMIASASFDGTVIVWSVVDRTYSSWSRLATLEGHDNEVKSISWNHDGLFLATCGRDKKIWVWEKMDKSDFECAAVLDGHTQDVKFIRWHPSENILFSCGYDDTIKIWAEDDGDWYCVTTLVGHSNTVWSIALDSDGTSLVSCSADLSVALWQSDSPNDAKRNWRKLSVLQRVHEYPIYSIDWNKLNRKIITGGGDDSISLLSCNKGDDGFATLSFDYVRKNAHEGDVNCVRWNPSYNPNLNGVLLSTGDDGLIQIWRVSDY